METQCYWACKIRAEFCFLPFKEVIFMYKFLNLLFFLKLIIFSIQVQADDLAKAPYKSKEKLFDSLNDAGFEKFVSTKCCTGHSITRVDKDGTRTTTPISNLDKKKLKRIPKLNYMKKGLTGKNLTMYAVNIADVMICYLQYSELTSWVSGQKKRKFKSCYIFPYDISEIVAEVSRISDQAAEH